jgi:ATP-dependent exoDNAse (exonuclease V) beta subunit
VSGISEQYQKIKEFIHEHLSDAVQFSDIAIVSKTWRSVEDLKDYLNNNGISAIKISKRYEKLKDNAVHLMTMHSIKGLEYDIVFAANLNKGMIPFKTEDNDLISRESNDKSKEISLFDEFRRTVTIFKRNKFKVFKKI